MTTFDEAHYRWKEEPNDGKYELQLDRFESTEEYHDQAVLLIVDQKIDTILGDVVLPTEELPEHDRVEDDGGGIFDGRIEDGELVEIRYNSELTEQRIKEAQELASRVQASSDDADDTNADK